MVLCIQHIAMSDYSSRSFCLWGSKGQGHPCKTYPGKGSGKWVYITLNICHLLALLGAHHILHVCRIMVNDNFINFVIFLFDGATGRGGPWPPLQYASKPLDPLLSLSLSLFPFVYSHLSQVRGHVIQPSLFWSSFRLVVYSFLYIFLGILHDQPMIFFGIL